MCKWININIYFLGVCIDYGYYVNRVVWVLYDVVVLVKVVDKVVSMVNRGR